MVKQTLINLWYSHGKIFKVWLYFNIIHEKVKQIEEIHFSERVLL